MDKQRLEEITGQFCDRYCRFARQCTNQDALDKICDKYPMNQLFELLE